VSIRIITATSVLIVQVVPSSRVRSTSATTAAVDANPTASSPLRVRRVLGRGSSGSGQATHAAPASRVKPTSQPVSTRVGTASLIAHVRVTTRNPTSPTV